jgi:hypothetical protein
LIAEKGHTSTCELLLDRSADVNAKDSVSLCEIEREGGIMERAFRREGKGAKGSVKALIFFFWKKIHLPFF